MILEASSELLILWGSNVDCLMHKLDDLNNLTQELMVNQSANTIFYIYVIPYFTYTYVTDFLIQR